MDKKLYSLFRKRGKVFILNPATNIKCIILRICISRRKDLVGAGGLGIRRNSFRVLVTIIKTVGN